MTDDTPAPSRRGFRRTTIVFPVAGLAIAIAIGAWLAWSRRSPPAAAAAPPLVQTALVARCAMPVVLQGVGSVAASDSAEVRPQTGGVIVRVLIHDGEQVAAGQPLFLLDARPLAASLAQARAQWARDRALADDAGAAAARLAPLVAKEYVTARDYESAVNTHRSLQAAADASRAAVDQARLALGYATVAAPIAGRAGAVLVKPGNLVAANNATALVVINVMSPVDLGFALPQEQARRLRDAASTAGGLARLPVQARDSATGQVRASGLLSFIDNALDASAGTIAVKARFTNADGALWPGEFYAARVTLRTQRDALVLPEPALQQGQSGAYVYVVDGTTARVRRVEVARVLDGRAAIASGVREGERVLTSIPDTLRDGSAVRVASSASATAP